MEFRIADTFTDSLARLTGDEQKAVKTTAFDLQLDPTNPWCRGRGRLNRLVGVSQGNAVKGGPAVAAVAAAGPVLVPAHQDMVEGPVGIEAGATGQGGPGGVAVTKVH